MSFSSVTEFENQIADFFGASYGVAVDCCTHAIELCLRHQMVKETSCPKRTYLSVPMTLLKLSISWEWDEKPWSNYYNFSNTNIIDAAVLWKQQSYIPGSLMCVSFQFHKHLSLGRGGMILLDDKKLKDQFVRLSYDGRDRDQYWPDQKITTVGYHYYMTPETAILGLEKLQEAKERPSKIITDLDYPDISKLPVFDQTTC
jgi:dTDP-4-amino-4,6-dideoxygalactose transaminase